MARIAALLFAPLLVVALVAGPALPAAAAPASDADRTAIQVMIGQQIEAFRHDDGGAAYSPDMGPQP